jgi:hypothetical protein
MRLSFVLLVLSAACQDAPTLPTVAASAGTAVARVSQGQHQRVPFYCTLGRYSPAAGAGWETRADTLSFPPGELDAAGRTVRYDYKISFTDGRPLASANCLVPYTEGALRRVDRRFGIKDGGGADQYRARQGMVTTQGCVKDENTGCVMDPLVVTAPPKDNTMSDPCEIDPLGCLTKHSGGEYDWWYDGAGSWSGGGAETPSDPRDTPTDTACNTPDPVVNAVTVQTGFEELWKKSNFEVNGVVQPQAERREQGGFIISTAAGYAFQSFPSDWDYGPCSIGFPPDFVPPAGTVAWVHTHPFILGEQQTSCGEVIPGSGLYQNYAGKSSDGDNKTSAHWGIPGYLLDADHIARFTSDEAAADVPFGRCAY